MSDGPALSLEELRAAWHVANASGDKLAAAEARYAVAAECHRMAESESTRLRATCHAKHEELERALAIAADHVKTIEIVVRERDTARARVEILERLKAAHWVSPSDEVTAVRAEAKAAIVRARNFFEARIDAVRQGTKDARNWGRWQRAMFHRAVARIADLEREAALCNRGCQTW